MIWQQLKFSLPVSADRGYCSPGNFWLMKVCSKIVRSAGCPRTAPRCGYAFIDSSLIHREAVRNDIKTVYVPATQIAADNSLEGLANMVMVGKVIKETNIIPFENIDRALEKVISARHQNLAEANRKALALGYNL